VKKILKIFGIVYFFFVFSILAIGASTHYFGSWPSQLLQTGQTVEYHAGDDGTTEYGVAKSYTVLTTGQYSGTTTITINANTDDLSNECVQDNNTGLMWARYVMDACGPADDGLLFWEEYTVTDTDISFVNATSKIHRAGGDWDTAALCVGRKFTIAGTDSNDGTYTVTAVDVNDITVAEALTNEDAGDTVVVTTVDDLIWDMLDQANANALGGHTDWRVPNYYELASLVNLGACNPAIDGTTFPSTPSTYFWTASAHPCDGAYAFIVYFSNGTMNTNVKEQGRYYVRLVRGGI